MTNPAPRWIRRPLAGPEGRTIRPRFLLLESLGVPRFHLYGRHWWRWRYIGASDDRRGLLALVPWHQSVLTGEMP